MPDNTTGNSGPTPWPKGVSGNPRGRPSHAALRAALKPHEEETLLRLVALMQQTDKPATALEAIKTILAYLHGKPESVQIDDLADDEMLAVIMRRKEQQKQ